MDDHQLRVLEQLSEHQRKTSMSTRSGVITDIKSGDKGEQKVRICWGLGPNGEEIKSPWLSTTNQRGQSRERFAFKKGQNGRMVAPDGNFRLAYFDHGPESDKCPAPDHAKDEGEQADTYQNEKLKTTRSPEKHVTQHGDSTHTRVDSDHTHGMHLKDKNWYQTRDQGTQMVAGDGAVHATVTKDNPIVSKPWIIGPNPLEKPKV